MTSWGLRKRFWSIFVVTSTWLNFIFVNTNYMNWHILLPHMTSCVLGQFLSLFEVTVEFWRIKTHPERPWHGSLGRTITPHPDLDDPDQPIPEQSPLIFHPRRKPGWIALLSAGPSIPEVPSQLGNGKTKPSPDISAVELLDNCADRTEPGRDLPLSSGVFWAPCDINGWGSDAANEVPGDLDGVRLYHNHSWWVSLESSNPSICSGEDGRPASPVIIVMGHFTAR